MEDAGSLLAIYKPVVENTTMSFELEAPTENEFALRIESSLEEFEWLVMECDDFLCGYACATPHRAREAYRHSVETSIYIHDDYQRRGYGKQLYNALFESLSLLNYHSAYAGITLPNEPSIALHKAVGFRFIGIFHEVGFKFDSWHDVSWWERRIQSSTSVSGGKESVNFA